MQHNTEDGGALNVHGGGALTIHNGRAFCTNMQNRGSGFAHADRNACSYKAPLTTRLVLKKFPTH